MYKEFFIEYPGHNVDTRAKVAERFWEVHHADGDRDDGASWIASLDRQKVSSNFRNGVTLVVYLYQTCHHSPVIMLLCLPYTREGDYIRINGAVTTTNYPAIRHIGYNRR